MRIHPGMRISLVWQLNVSIKSSIVKNETPKNHMKSQVIKFVLDSDVRSHPLLHDDFRSQLVGIGLDCLRSGCDLNCDVERNQMLQGCAAAGMASSCE